MVKTGVIYVNLGTPEEPTKKGVRNFLKPFLSDRRVVDYPAMFWLPFLYCVILPRRSGRVANLYKEIWTPEGSPLLVYTRRQIAGVTKVLNERLAAAKKEKELAAAAAGDETSSLEKYAVDASNRTTEVVVTFAMTYTKPSIKEEILRLHQKEKCERIILVPLYPQYSGTTTGPVFHQVGELVFAKEVNIPNVRFVHDYYRRHDFLMAIANSIRRHRDAIFAKAEASAKKDDADTTAVEVAAPTPLSQRLLLFSYHGIPEACVENGDPYADHCYQTSKGVAAILGLEEGTQWRMSYQSRFGPAEWLKPYTDDLLELLPTEAGGNHFCVDVVCPAFAVDCLETLEEIELCSREHYTHAGGKEFTVVPCLNDSEDHIQVLANMAMDEMHF